MPPMGENGRPPMPPQGNGGMPQPPQGNGGMPQPPQGNGGMPQPLQGNGQGGVVPPITPNVERPLTDTEKITAEINARRQAEAQKQAAAFQQAKDQAAEQAQEAEKPTVSTTSTLKPTNSTKKKSSKLRIIIIGIVIVLAIIILGSCMLKSCSKKIENAITNGGSNIGNNTNVISEVTDPTPSQSGFSWTSLANNYYTDDNWEDNTGSVITDVAAGVPEKQTEIYGDGTDKVNVMVYMCGSDLESQCGSATSDIKEMLNATIGDNVNLIVFTGGTTKWQNNAISSDYNQIYQIKGGELFRIQKNFGDKAMTKPDTLAEFIQFCDGNFDANRNVLILWDHGGGSVEGYGHDEKYSYNGSMNLAAIKTALKKGGVNFDFIGFDACLMGTVETGLALSDYSDYLIASEETEDASGWYYTNWLTKLNSNTGMGTVELGKIICDDFVKISTQNSPGYGATLSVTDLKELSTTVPSKLQAFGKKVSAQIANDNGSYSSVAKVRSKSREFGESYQIDQVDAVDFAKNLGTTEGKAFAQAVLGAVKYNKVSRNMSNAYGLSIYFPYANSQYASTVESVYNAIGICSEYTDAVQQYASLEMSGQYLSGGGSPFNSLFGIFGSGDYGANYYGNDYSGSDYSNLFDLNSLLGGNGNYGNSYSSNYSSNFFGGYDYNDYSTDYSTSDMSDLLGSLLGSGGFFGDRAYTSKMNKAAASEFLAGHIFDQTQLEWKTNKKGQQIITLDDDQWRMVDHILLNAYYDDGEGLIDLGTDNVFDFDDDGNLIGENDKTWLSIDGNIVAYYYESTYEGSDGSYEITGYVPVMYNGQLAKMVLVFSSENPEGYIAGLRYDYSKSEDYIGVVAKFVSGVQAEVVEDFEEGLWENSFIAEDVAAAIKEGDQIDFIADYYDYGGNYLDSYVIGSWYATANPEIANMTVGDGTVLAMYSFTDIYNQTYWTAAME
ncbi:MAG: clostripain-related cysteine peptidase [Lachnospiraceae bacterium]|nr:clostripain-related cysteine peptidase [Lachnospiraceae bacterium]